MDQNDIDVSVSHKKRNRGANFSFAKCGIPIGAELKLLHHPEYIAVVKDDCNVEYQGSVYALSILAQKLLAVSYPVSGTRYWTYNGKAIKDIRKERERQGLY